MALVEHSEHDHMIDMIHSYFDHVSKNVKVFLPYFDEIFLTYYMARVERGTVDTDMMEKLLFMACWLSKDVQMPFDYSAAKSYGSNRPFKFHQWLKVIDNFENLSKQGVVKKCLIFNSDTKVVVKTSKSSQFDKITVRDFCVGISLNKLKCPFFVKTLACFDHKNEFHIVTEYVEGVNLKIFLQNKKTTFRWFLNIFFQILLGLEIAQDKLNFSHYDLHSDNVIVVKQHPKKTHQVCLHGHLYEIKSSHVPVMIDFGLSSVHVKGQTLGQTNLKNKGIHPHISPGYDMYIFLLFCLDTVEHSNPDVYKGIADLLKFFKITRGVSMSVLINNHVRSLEEGVFDVVPKKFIDYLMDTPSYSKHLKIKVTKHSRAVDFLAEIPSQMRMGSFFNMTNTMEFINTRPPLVNRGLIRSLIYDIKMFYWIDKRHVPISSEHKKTLMRTDFDRLTFLINSLGTVHGCITPLQKVLFFKGLEYHNFIVKLGLDNDHIFYKKWLDIFKDTFVYKNIFDQLTSVLTQERLNKIGGGDLAETARLNL